MIDMGKPEVTNIRKLPHVVKFLFDDGAPANVKAQIRRKGGDGCVRSLTIVADSSKSIDVELGRHLAKLGHGAYDVELVKGCEVCVSECVYLDYSCSKYVTEHTEPRSLKEGCPCG